MRVKHLVTDEQWAPRAGIELVKKVPTGVPVAAEYRKLGGESHGKYMKSLTKTVEKLEENKFLDEEQMAWWKKVLREESIGEVPQRYTNESESRQVFPSRNLEDDAFERRVIAENEIATSLTQADREHFGEAQRKEVYIGKRMTRVRRNDRAADIEKMEKGSFVMARGSAKEPLLFGMVEKIHAEEKRFTLHYYRREDMTGSDITGKFSPCYNAGEKKRGRKPAAKKWLGEVGFECLMCFDLQTTTKSRSGMMSLTKKAQKRCLEEVDELGSFAEDDVGAVEESEDDMDFERMDSEEDREGDLDHDQWLREWYVSICKYNCAINRKLEEHNYMQSLTSLT
jgi:hypothetical protein